MASPNPSPASRRPLVVFVIATDPRETHRPAEAIRVAAGLGAWKKADVRVYLRGPAIRGLGEWVDDLRMEDDFIRYLPIIRDWGHPVWVQAGAAEIGDLGEPSAPFEEIDDVELAKRCAAATSVLRF